MKAIYYMGSGALSDPTKFKMDTFDNIEDALAAVSKTVAGSRETRYVVKVVAMVEPVPPPVRVTLVDE